MCNHAACRASREAKSIIKYSFHVININQKSLALKRKIIFKMTIPEYISALNKLYKAGIATEHSYSKRL